jgi:hypothetical protein
MDLLELVELQDHRDQQEPLDLLEHQELAVHPDLQEHLV